MPLEESDEGVAAVLLAKDPSGREPSDNEDNGLDRPPGNSDGFRSGAEILLLLASPPLASPPFSRLSGVEEEEEEPLIRRAGSDPYFSSSR